MFELDPRHNQAGCTMPPNPIDPSTGLMLQMLRWIDATPRTYGSTMEAWRTTCPRISVWEDALADGLVAITGSGRQSDSAVRLTPRGAQRIGRVA